MGFTTNTIETFIGELPEDVTVFYIINDTDDKETFLNDDPIWQSLPFVREGASSRSVVTRGPSAERSRCSGS